MLRATKEGDTRSDFYAWLGIVGPPVAWIVNFEIIYAGVLSACEAKSKIALLLSCVICLALIAGCGFLALRELGAALSSAHMTHHERLMLVAAPLLVLGRPMIPFLWAFPKASARRLSTWTRATAWQRIWRAITVPFVAWVIHAVVLWGWHVPSFF